MSSLRRAAAAVLGPGAFLGLAFVILGAALALGFTLLASFLVEPLADAAILPLPMVIAVGLMLGAALTLAVGVLPPVRRIEGVACQSLLSVAFDGGPPQAAAHWPDRLRSAGWLGVHALAGAALVAWWAAIPVVAVERSPWLLLPAVPTLPVLGALLVAGLRRLAPVLLGPSLRERVDRLEQDATDLGERHRIAREIHDSVGHALSLVTVQAAAAARVQHSDPDFVAGALASIESAARQAAGELDHVLVLLRVEETPRRPTPDLADLPDLVDAARRAGLDVTLENRPEEVGFAVPPVVSRELYRVTQEALSNVLRHGTGPVGEQSHPDACRSRAGIRLPALSRRSAAGRTHGAPDAALRHAVEAGPRAPRRAAGRAGGAR